MQTTKEINPHSHIAPRACRECLILLSFLLIMPLVKLLVLGSITLLMKAKWEESWLGISKTQMDGEANHYHMTPSWRRIKCKEFVFVCWCCMHCSMEFRIHLVYLKWEHLELKLHKKMHMPTSLDLSLYLWVEGSIYETSLLTCCAKWWTRFVVVQPVCFP